MKKTLVVWIAVITLPAMIACVVALSIFHSQLLDSAESTHLFFHQIERDRINSTLKSDLDALALIADNQSLQRFVDAHFLASISERAANILYSSAEFSQYDLTSELPLQPLADTLLNQAKSEKSNVVALQVVGKRDSILAQTSHYSTTHGLAYELNETGTATKARVKKIWVAKDKGTLMLVQIPILDTNRRYLGVLNAEIVINDIINDLTRYAELGDTTEAFLTLPEGSTAEIISPAHHQFSINQIKHASPWSNSLLKPVSDDGTVGAQWDKDQSSDAALVTFSTIPSIDWGFFLKTDRSEILSPVSTIRNLLLSMTGVSALLLIASVASFFLPLSRRIKKLKIAADHLSRRNFEFRINDKKKDELGILSRKLDELSAEYSSTTNLQVAVLEQINYRDNHDEITGLLNREAIIEKQSQMEQLEPGNPITALAIDMQSTPAGTGRTESVIAPELLGKIASELQALLPKKALAARWSGNVLMALLPGMDTSAAEKLAFSVQKNVSKALSTNPQSVELSFGIATCSANATGEQLLQNAMDEVRLLRNSDVANADLRQSSVKLVKDAIDDNRIDVWYQPIFDLSDGKTNLLGAEAMVRVRTVEGEVITADKFIPHIQDHPIGATLDQVVVALVIKNANLWQANDNYAHDLTISINVSSRSLKDLKLKNLLTTGSQDCQFDLNSLVFEVPPAALSDNIETLIRYKATGVKFAVDQQGAQNVSLAELKNFKPDYLKFDWSELSSTGNTSNALAATQLFKLLGFFKSLNIAIISKNVENKAQSKALLKRGIALQQGYLFGYATDLDTFVANWINPEYIDKAG